MSRRLSPWPLLALHALAAMALATIVLLGGLDMSDERPLDALLESGKWALRFLIICLAMTPLQRYLGWQGAGRLRKPAGLWAFAFAALHAALYVAAMNDMWLQRLREPFLLIGVGSLLILTALALTSSRRAMAWLGRSWKRLHRLVYLAGAATTLHALLAAIMSKRVLVRDPQALLELRLAAAIVAALLVVRIPLVRRRLQPAAARLLRRSPVTATIAPRPAVEPAPLPPLPGDWDRAIIPPTLAPYEPPGAPEEEEVAV
jgi:sulfoxide reductase heme-binding subunit YedZ